MGVYASTQGWAPSTRWEGFFADATGSHDTAATLYHTSLLRTSASPTGSPIWGTLWVVGARAGGGHRGGVGIADLQRIRHLGGRAYAAVRTAGLSRRFEAATAQHRAGRGAAAGSRRRADWPLSGRGGHGRRVLVVAGGVRCDVGIGIGGARGARGCRSVGCGRGTVDSHFAGERLGAVGPRRPRLSRRRHPPNAGRAPSRSAQNGRHHRTRPTSGA